MEVYALRDPRSGEYYYVGATRVSALTGVPTSIGRHQKKTGHSGWEPA